MAKLLSSATFKGSKCLPLLYQRHFSGELTGKWNDAALHNGRNMPKAERKCPPLEGSCAATMGICPRRRFPKCAEPDIKPATHLSCCSDNRLTEQPCDKPKKKLETPAEQKPFVSMWETCGMEKKCPNVVERLDDFHYKSTDKTKRIYTQTWESCAPVIRNRKVCCINDMCMLPPITKRRKAACPSTAKEQDTDLLKEDYNVLKKCLQEKMTQIVNKNGQKKCQKIRMPCCRKVAKNLKCRAQRKSQCLRECCPNPSFSECNHPALRTEPPRECRCLHLISQCDADQFLSRKEFFKLPPSLPARPVKERPK